MSTTSFAEELRTRSDSELSKLFSLRPDLVTPLPGDMAALAARANSMPSLIRAIESLNKWQLDCVHAICTLEEPFAKNELVSITEKGAALVLEELWAFGLIYQDGAKFAQPHWR